MSSFYQLHHFAFGPLSLAYIFAAPAILLLGLMVVWRERGQSLSTVYLVFTFSISGWIFHTGLLIASQSPIQAMVMETLSKLPVALLPGALFHYLQILTGRQSRNIVAIRTVWGGSLLFFLLILFNENFATVQQHYWGYYSEYGITAKAFIAFFVAVFTWGLVGLWQHSREADLAPHIRQRMRMMVGVIAFSALGFVDFLPGLGVDVQPMGVIFAATMFILTTYVTWQYRLTDFRPEYVADNLLQAVNSPMLVFDEHGELRLSNTIARCLFNPQELQRLTQQLFPRAVEQYRIYQGKKEFPRFQMRPQGIDLKHTFEVSVSPVYTPHRQLRGYVCLLNDISEHMQNLGQLEQRVRARTQALHDEVERHRETIAELQEAQRQAQQALHTKSIFLSRMSHELRTPMNAVIGFTQLLQQDYAVQPPANPDHVSYVNMMADSGQNLLQMIDSILDFSRVDSEQFALNMESIDLLPLLDEARHHLQHMAKAKGIQIVIEEGECAPAQVYADRARVSQVLGHLLHNAIKFNQNAGEVRVSCSMEQGVQRVTIADQGEGIPPQHLESIFAPFEHIGQDIHHNKGVGVSLALCRLLIQHQGGKMGVDSESGVGSRFWFELPSRPRDVNTLQDQA